MDRNNASFDVPQNSAEQIHVAHQPDKDHRSSSTPKMEKAVGTLVQRDNAVGKLRMNNAVGKLRMNLAV